MKKLKISDFFICFSVAAFSLVCLVPMLLTVMVSVTEEEMIRRNGYSFFPEKFSIYAYKLIFHGSSSVMNSYLITIFVTCAGTAAAVLITAAAAYTLSNKQVKYRNHLALYFFITMIFNAGLVPWYMVCRSLRLTDSLLSLIIPGLMFSPFNLFLTRNFMDGIPDSLRESATIDGANDITIAIRIYFPLSIPVLATISLFYGLTYWNDWFNAIMLVDNDRLYPLQYLLLVLQSQISMINKLQGNIGQGQLSPPTESIKMATTIATIGPIVLLYPFLQRYFVKGLIIGSVKG